MKFLRMLEIFKIFDRKNNNDTSNGTTNITVPGDISGSDEIGALFLQIASIICIIGVFTNLINISVFVNPRLNDRSFKYMLVNSIIKIVFLSFFIIDYYILKEFCSDCEVTFTYGAQMFFFLVDDYFSSVCAIFCILIDIVMSLERLFVVLNKKYLSKMSYKVIMIVCLVASFGMYYFIILY